MNIGNKKLNFNLSGFKEMKNSKYFPLLLFLSVIALGVLVLVELRIAEAIPFSVPMFIAIASAVFGYINMIKTGLNDRKENEQISKPWNNNDLHVQEKARRILSEFPRAEFISLENDAPRSPLELIKETPRRDKVLPLLAEMTKIECITEQIEFATREKWVDVYSDSWAERELQLIGFYLLTKLGKSINQFTDMYDAGCANYGQYTALLGLKQTDESKVSPEFKYLTFP